MPLVLWKVRVFLLCAAFAITLSAAIQSQYEEERATQDLLGAVEVTGTLRDELITLSSRCGAQNSPTFYIATSGNFNAYFNAYYLFGSRFPYGMRNGKVIITEDFVQFLSRDALYAFVAHELGHREEDRGWFRNLPIFGERRARVLEWEIRADAFGANCVGKEKFIAAFYELTRLCSNPNDPRFSQTQRTMLNLMIKNGRLKEFMQEFSSRIKALNTSQQP